MKDKIKLGSIWLNRETFKRNMFCGQPFGQYMMVDLHSGLVSSDIVSYLKPEYIGDGKFVTDIKVFEAITGNTRFEEVEYSGVKKEDPRSFEFPKTQYHKQNGVGQFETLFDAMFGAGYFQDVLEDVISKQSKEEETETKPSQINVVRYIRERDIRSGYVGNSGMTMVFDVDFDRMIYSCAISLCSKHDTFSKEVGVAMALDGAENRGHFVVGDYNKEIPLVQNLLNDLRNIKEINPTGFPVFFENVLDYIVCNWAE